MNCQPDFNILIKSQSSTNLNAKETNRILQSLDVKDYAPKYQIIDARFKCKFIVTNAGYIIPTVPSGIVRTINIVSNINNYVNDYNTTYKYLSDINKLSRGQLKLKPIGIYYSEKRQKTYIISAIMTLGYDAIPVTERSMTSEYIKKEKLLVQNRPNDDVIDRDISRGKSSIVVDDRIYEVSMNKYNNETYQLFRYHLSYFLNNTTEGTRSKKEIERILGEKTPKRDRKIELKQLLYNITNSDLAKTFSKLITRINETSDTSDANKQSGGLNSLDPNSYPYPRNTPNPKDLVYPNLSTDIEDIEDLADSENTTDLADLQDLHNLQNQDLGSDTSDTSDLRTINPLAQANSPISIAREPENSIQIIPSDFVDGHRNTISSAFNDFDNTESGEFDFSEQINPINNPFDYSTDNAPVIAENVHFPRGEKNWIHIMPDTKVIDYPSYVLRNNREYCFINRNKDSCNVNKYCNWSGSKNLCLFSVKREQLIDFVNQIAEELILNELKASEILRRGEYSVSNIVNYSVFTERPGERIVMSSNANIERILSEIFGKENIPRIGKKRYKYSNEQTYEQMNFDNPLRETNIWYLQNIIDNNNTIFRTFANVYYWLVHPYNEKSIRNLGYYSPMQTTLSNIYKSQVVEWLLSKENEELINSILPYVKYQKIGDFVTKLNMEVNTTTNGIVELYVLSRKYETIIYVYDEYYNIVYVLHPTQGIVYDYKKSKDKFSHDKYQNYKKIVNMRFRYQSDSNYPDNIDALYPK